MPSLASRTGGTWMKPRPRTPTEVRRNTSRIARRQVVTGQAQRHNAFDHQAWPQLHDVHASCSRVTRSVAIVVALIVLVVLLVVVLTSALFKGLNALQVLRRSGEQIGMIDARTR